MFILKVLLFMTDISNMTMICNSFILLIQDFSVGRNKPRVQRSNAIFICYYTTSVVRILSK